MVDETYIQETLVPDICGTCGNHGEVVEIRAMATHAVIRIVCPPCLGRG